jgi:hypothetical protein
MIKLHVIKTNGQLQIWVAIQDPKSILWINQGIYALIPIEVVRNEMSIQQDKAKISGVNSICAFAWDQAIIISPEAGKVLANEDQNKTHECTDGGNDKGNIERIMKM